MRFSIFYEHQLPRPWNDGAEARVVHEALSFAFINPDEAKQWVADYYAAFEACTDPVGLAPNPNIAVTTGFLCHEDICESVELFAREIIPAGAATPQTVTRM